MQTTGFDPDSVESTLDEVSRLHALRTDAEARIFELAARFADRHSTDSLPGSGLVLPGLERAVRVGGMGTPRVAEFAFAELGARLQMSPWTAKRLVADALDVRHRLPLIWIKVLARTARISNARLVAAKTRHLSPEATASVDRAMAECVDGSLPWGRFEVRLTGVIVAADPAVAAEREAAAVAEQFAKRTRVSEHGTAGLYVRSTVGVIARLDATITFLADALVAFGDPDIEDLRRVKAVALLANPVRAVELLAAFAALRSAGCDTELPLDEEPVDDGDQPFAPGRRDTALDALSRMDAFARRVGFTPLRLPDWLTSPPLAMADPPGLVRPGFRFDWAALLPPLTMYLHFSAAELARGEGGVVRVEGEGPVTHQFVHEHLRPLHSYVVKPVIDLARQASVDAYEIPTRLREATHLAMPADGFPFGGSLSRTADVDHTTPYAAGGETAFGNLAGLGRFHHRIKTHGRWQLRQPFAGVLVWRDPHGQVYVVDDTGTHQTTRPSHPAGGPGGPDPEVEVYPAENVVAFAELG